MEGGTTPKPLLSGYGRTVSGAPQLAQNADVERLLFPHFGQNCEDMALRVRNECSSSGE